MQFFDQNLKALIKRYPFIFEQIRGLTENACTVCKLLVTRSGLPTVWLDIAGRQFYLHSKYDPVKEAEQFINENYSPGVKTYVIYGFGLGYHIRKLLEKDQGLKVVVFETNKAIMKLALENTDLQDLLAAPNLEIIVAEEVADFCKEFGRVLEDGNEKLIVHLPSLNAMPEKFFVIKQLLENFRVEANSAAIDHGLHLNFAENIQNYDMNVDALFDRFQGVPVVIVAAGPSLDKNKALLKEVKNRALLFVVGTAVKPLLKEGVQPDLIIITDPQEIVYNQIEGLEISIPVVVLSTCNRLVSTNYKGFKYLALQKGFPPAEKFAEENQSDLVRTGGSVSTTALDIALRFGCDPIIFVGLDLAYTGGTSHVQGTHFYRKIEKNKHLRPVEDINGQIIYTGKNLHIYLKWIENRIKEEQHRAFIDATEGGARIEGSSIMTLQQVVSTVLKDCSYRFDELLGKK